MQLHLGRAQTQLQEGDGPSVGVEGAPLVGHLQGICMPLCIDGMGACSCPAGVPQGWPPGTLVDHSQEGAGLALEVF